MASVLTQYPASAPYGLFSQDTAAQIDLGSKFVDKAGNEYVYLKAGATALVAGTLLQAPAEATNHQDVVPAAAAIGATSVTVTLGATAATANQYAGGWLLITVTPGEGYKYLIASHPAANASATLVLTLEDPIQVALTTASNCDLVPNPYNGVVINPTIATSCPVAVATDVVAISGFGWGQTKGVACILSDGGSTVGTNVSASNATAGAVEAAVTAQAFVGVAVTGVATTEYGAFKINL